MATRDTRRTTFTRVGVLLLAACGAHHATAAGDLFRTHIDTVSIAPSGQPRVGEPVVVSCRWSAKFYGFGTNEIKTVFELAPASMTHIWADFHVVYQAGSKGGASKSVDYVAKPGYYTEDHPLAGESKWTWVPTEAGAALATCVVHGPYDPWEGRSKLQLPLWVFPPKQEIAGAANSPAGAAVVVTPPARLSIEGATAAPTGNCTGTMPRAVAVIKLQLRNSGKALPAGRGIASAKCCSGLLANPGVYLPAIAPGQTVTVDVPVGFTQSLPSGPTYLVAAPRMFTIVVKPTNADAFPAPQAHLLTVEFPPGTCGKPSRAVAPARATPGSNAGRRVP
jgi:hypothetical protein